MHHAKLCLFNYTQLGHMLADHIVKSKTKATIYIMKLIVVDKIFIMNGAKAFEPGDFSRMGHDMTNSL